MGTENDDVLHVLLHFPSSHMVVLQRNTLHSEDLGLDRDLNGDDRHPDLVEVSIF